MSALLRGWTLAASALALTACALIAHRNPPTGAGAYGQLRLVPRAGVTPGPPGDASSCDRRLRDVTFVDSAHPGFAVVWVEGQLSPAGQTELSIHDGGVVLATLRDLPPGHRGLRAWYPRFTAASQALGVTEGSATSVNIEMGVDRAAEDADAVY